MYAEKGIVFISTGENALFNSKNYLIVKSI